MTRFLIGLSIASFAGWASGCVELGPLPPADGDTTDGTPSDDETDGSGPGETRSVVTLTVSNPTPQVNEQVVLTCSVVSGGEGVTFDFQPADGRLRVDQRRGTASFIVQESDIGVAIPFTCTATNDAGTSERSNAQVVTPT